MQSTGASAGGTGAAGAGAPAGPNNAAANGLIGPAPDAVPANATSASSGTPTNTAPAVFIHVQSKSLQEWMWRLAPLLHQQGIQIAGIKVVPRGPAQSDVRYFHDGEQAEAAHVQQALVSLGLPVQRLKKIQGFEPVAVKRQYEVWLAAAYRPQEATNLP